MEDTARYIRSDPDVQSVSTRVLDVDGIVQPVARIGGTPLGSAARIGAIFDIDGFSRAIIRATIVLRVAIPVGKPFSPAIKVFHLDLTGDCSGPRKRCGRRKGLHVKPVEVTHPTRWPIAVKNYAHHLRSSVQPKRRAHHGRPGLPAICCGRELITRDVASIKFGMPIATGTE